MLTIEINRLLYCQLNWILEHKKFNETVQSFDMARLEFHFDQKPIMLCITRETTNICKFCRFAKHCVGIFSGIAMNTHCVLCTVCCHTWISFLKSFGCNEPSATINQNVMQNDNTFQSSQCLCRRLHSIFSEKKRFFPWF